jgi:hypothetical protein
VAQVVGPEFKPQYRKKEKKKKRIGQRCRLQSSSKVLLKGKGKYRQKKIAQERVGVSGQMAQKPRSLFKGQFKGCKGKGWEKSGHLCRRG